MSERLKNVDRETAMLLPPDLREWIPEDDFVHFIIETCKRLNLTAFKLNRRGTGSCRSLHYGLRKEEILPIYCI